ncbi:hypothetical protein B0H17DRAFT_964274 [Mycena rosella]|uniref:CxC6 like cysteine cluster associated with KDZ domain-containing protein n=1 Tax=Mycena rosella TaxID=1033263 RepID=A0AAD7FJL9_MYCRO|nr:hypothetical protein B0H17DRAFT_964274 [Mycena rosella]
MAGTGQDMWAHACNPCMKIYQGEDGNWSVTSQRDRFCHSHRALDLVCCIVGCDKAAHPGFCTCGHRAFQK